MKHYIIIIALLLPFITIAQNYNKNYKHSENGSKTAILDFNKSKSMLYTNLEQVLSEKQIEYIDYEIACNAVFKDAKANAIILKIIKQPKLAKKLKKHPNLKKYLTVEELKYLRMYLGNSNILIFPYAVGVKVFQKVNGVIYENLTGYLHAYNLETGASIVQYKGKYKYETQKGSTTERSKTLYTFSKYFINALLTQLQ